jgi:hypothetical protein
VPKSAGTLEIQQTINAAARLGGARPVVHIPEGNYKIDGAVVIPRGSDLQVVGDGYFATRLQWYGDTGGAVFRVLGPSKITVRELAISGSTTASGVVVDGIDQPGSRVYLQQTQLGPSREANLLVDGLDYTNVDLRNIGHASSQTGVSIKVVGGKQAAAGAPHGGKTNLFSGSSSNNALSYELSNNGRLLVRDIWYETPAPSGYLRLLGEGTFTLHGSAVALPALQKPPAAELLNFRGSATFLTTTFQDRIVSSGDSTGARILALGFMGGVNVPDYLQNQGSPAAETALLNSRSQIRRGSSVRTDDRGAADPQFLRQMLSQTREEQPGAIGDLPAGVTDIRFYRVSVSNTVIGIHLQP